MRRAPVGSPLFFTLLLLVAALWVFLQIADEVHEGETQHLDREVVRALRDPADPARPLGPLWLPETARDATALGGVPVLAFITLTVAGFLALSGKGRSLWLVLGTTLGGLALSLLLKEGFARPRPDVVPHLTQTLTASFPSGHSMLSAVVYLTLALQVSALVPKRRLKVYVICIALLLTVLIGLSRVYLGVHYPTDVLAGWAAGLAWALLSALVARALRRRSPELAQEAAHPDAE
ncbi:phosphatase PAP2 family protein [Aggregicoccus sp. 17bor-14]|nr:MULTISPECIES: phosphatase PAP2 family protein [Myxococcaceae]MBF5045414.1 phosphatase PAP2 family protein [Simulacricoccus sp. 17bor-14]MRI91155.1 phosphatase PAP2 family protein [Aggregicoccus sp. 17bor-14]